MDIQFVLEEYGIASYIANYLSKADGGLSKLLRSVAKDLNMGNHTLLDKYRA